MLRIQIKKKRAKRPKPGTPSKQLAQCVSKLLLSSKYSSDDDESDGKEKEELFDDRNEEIISLQQQLLTQEVNYKLIGRDKEYKRIQKFIEKHLKSQQGDSFYICGSPGTGKSATLSNITNHFMTVKNRKKFKLEGIIKINGMSLNNPSSIYPLLCNHIFHEKRIKPIDAKNKLEAYFMSTSLKKMYVVIIDEMDGLLSNNKQQILYHLFGWTKRKNCKLILFGIANSIDLTDRFLPRLKQRKFEPELMIFKPYTKEQLFDILQYRLNILLDNEWDKYFEEIALKLCTQKVAKMYGDVRKLLEIVRNALNLLLMDETIEKIGFIQMKQILSSSFESPLIEIIKDLPNQQKTILVISAILVFYKNKKQTEGEEKEQFFVYNKLADFYKFMSKKYILPKISSREFNIIIDSLISDHIIQQIHGGKSCSILSNDTKLQLMISYDDIQFAVKEDNVLNKLFDLNIVVPLKYIR